MPGTASVVRRVVWALALVLALVATACSSGGEEVADAPGTAGEEPSAETPTTAPTVAPTADATVEPADESADESAGQARPDVASAMDVEPAELGTYVVARDGAGIRRAGTDDAPAELEIPVYETPFGPPRVLLDQNAIDGVDLPIGLVNPPAERGALVLRVIAGGPDDDWLQVQAPARPNNSYVWVRRSDFDFGYTDKRIEIDLADEGELVLMDGDEVVLRSDLVQGRDNRPTPTHVTFVERGVRGVALSPAYGTAVLSIASFSEVLGTFGGGGLPSNFIHGTNQPQMMGQAVSSGEIRLRNEVLDQIIETITPGTPVLLFDSSDAQRDRAAVLATEMQLSATVSFAEGTPEAADATAGVESQLWVRCSDDATQICRR